MTEPQFGRPPPGREPRDRLAAFAVVERDGRIATACIRRPERTYTDLPGGALEAGEDAAAACVREFGEETGLVIRTTARLGHASQHLTTVEGEEVNNRCAFFDAEWLGEDPALKIEPDHELRWHTPLEALRLLRHEAHAWAVALWLRR